MYDRYVTMICGKMGDDITYENELKTMVKQSPFKGKFKGVHPRDKMEKIIKNIKNKKSNDQYHIFNLDTRAQGGSHWCGCVISKGIAHIYDSFGRKIHVKKPAKHSDLSDREQDVAENNCGQRCVAWLLTCHNHTLDKAMLI